LKNVNLTKVRSGTATRVIAAALAAGAVAAAWAAPAWAQPEGVGKPEIERVARGPSVTVAILPHGTEPRDLEGIEGLSPGVMSAGLSDVAPAQTFLDIGAGNRVFTSLYDEGLPVFLPFGRRVPDWGVIVERAEDAPAEIVPGLLASTLRDDGSPPVPMRADSLLTTPALMAADRAGRVGRTRPFACLDRRCAGVAVVPATLGQLPALIGRLRGEDMLLAFERPPAAEREVLAIGAAGEGFGGNLTSDTTRTPGFVLATDIGPTILSRFGIGVPEQMQGDPIRSEGERDAGAVQDRADRMKVVSKRRGAAVLRNMIAWFLLAAVATGLTRGRAGRVAFALFGLSVVYLPAMLLVGAAVQPEDVLGERLIVGLGAPALAAITFMLARGWLAMAIACGVTLAAYAIDIVAGSPLTAQSLLGPNPGLGVRFFGIGNELEATLAVVIPIGVGAALSAAAALGRSPSRRAAIAAFLVAGGVSALIFASGRFGADVGAAIVFPTGAAVAALALPGVAAGLRGRKLLVAALVAAPLIGLAALLAIDLALGGDAHLSRSVLDAGGAGELADVAERRLRLGASSFGRAVGTLLFWFCVLVVVVAVLNRHRILAWLAAAPLARAGFAGAAASCVLGVVANDSAATFFTIGTLGLLACTAFAWSQRQEGDAAH
jgi:hypothetical protein